MNTPILANPQQANPGPPSAEIIARRTADRIVAIAKQTYDQLLHVQREGVKTVWQNSEGLTPQQVCDALGTRAGKLWDFHAALTQVIIGVATMDGIQPNILLPTNNVTVNADGTVTVLETPYTPPSQ